jgi:hypothetical protein
MPISLLGHSAAVPMRPPNRHSSDCSLLLRTLERLALSHVSLSYSHGLDPVDPRCGGLIIDRPRRRLTLNISHSLYKAVLSLEGARVGWQGGLAKRDLSLEILSSCSPGERQRTIMARAMSYNVAGGLQGMLKEGTKSFQGEASSRPCERTKCKSREPLSRLRGQNFYASH